MIKLFLLAATFTTMVVHSSMAQATTNEPLQPVINAYLDVKNALTADNGVAARSAAKVLFTAISDVATDKLPPVEQRVWMEYKDKLSYDAEHMKGTDELGHLREHFMKLSDNFYNMVKVLNINSADLYYQFCPMANDGKGAYWVSEKQAIRNPYFGKMMMSCGSTKETLKAKS